MATKYCPTTVVLTIPTPLFASRLVAVGLPLVTSGCAAHARRALRALRARFVYTEEAKALQAS